MRIFNYQAPGQANEGYSANSQALPVFPFAISHQPVG